MKSSGNLVIPRDLWQAYKAAKRAGWRFQPLRNSHSRWLSPDGKAAVTVPATPSDWRAVSNTISRLRQAGLNI